MAQVGRLGPKVGSHLALLCIHRVNPVNSHNDLSHDDNTINICCYYYYNYLCLTVGTE